MLLHSWKVIADMCFFCQQKTAYELRISDWSSDVCSSDLDSARMADVLAPLGYRPVDAPDGADMVILNTCHIREKAAEKVYSELGRLRRLKQAKRSEEHTLNSSH